MTSILGLVVLNIVLAGFQIFLIADMAGYKIDIYLSMALSSAFVVFFGGAVGSAWDFKRLAERRLSFNLIGLICVCLAYMLSG